jgi:hypothetical protein
MKRQLRKPARERASYTEPYKQEALKLWRASGRSAAKLACGKLGVSVQILTYRYPFIARLTKPARRFGNLGSFLARVARRRS